MSDALRTLERVGAPPTDFAGQPAPACSAPARELGKDPCAFATCTI